MMKRIGDWLVEKQVFILMTLVKLTFVSVEKEARCEMMDLVHQQLSAVAQKKFMRMTKKAQQQAEFKLSEYIPAM